MKNMFSLALQGLLRKKQQTILVVSILTISFAFAVMMISYTSSIVKTNEEYRYDTYGEWYGCIALGQDGDIEYIESTSWGENVGALVNYGYLMTKSQSREQGAAYLTTSYFFGAFDDGFTDVGRVSMLEGRLPEEDNEIALTTNLLIYLGYYDYEIGDTIRINVGYGAETEIADNYLTKSFILTGVIADYTQIWSVDNVNMISAIITSDAAEDIFEQEKETFSIVVPDPVTSYFFTVKEGFEDVIAGEVRDYLSESRDSSVSRVYKYMETNTSAYVDNGETDYNTVYVIIIFVIALIAVILVYVLQMQSQIQKIVRMRSLGATRSQLFVLIVFETLLVCLPSILLGTILGVIGIWLLLRFSIFAGSVSVFISIPWTVLLLAVLCWLVGVLLIRIATFMVSLRTPLTGRMVMKRKTRRFYSTFQRVLIVVISSALCAVVIFTSTNSAYQLNRYNYFSNNYSYSAVSFYADGVEENGKYISEAVYITEDVINQLSEIPGVSAVWGYTELLADLEVGDVSLENVSVYAVDSSGWDNAIDFSTTDLEAFENGDCIILSMVGGDDYELPQVGAEAVLTVTSPIYRSDESEDVVVSTTVGGVSVYEYNSSKGSTYLLNGVYDSSYTVICSLGFLQKVVDILPENGFWSLYGSLFGDRSDYLGYVSGATVGYISLMAFTDNTAKYLSTDTIFAKTLAENSINAGFLNTREFNDAHIQEHMQTLIMLLVSGGCIAIIILIILSSTIRLETQREKRRYGILQAIGMSKRQRNLELMRTALLRSVVAVALGWGAFFLTVIFRNLESIKEEGATVVSVVSSYMSNITNYYMPVWAMVVMTVILFAVVFLICYLSKLSLNKYSLMEMLHDE